MRLALPGKSYTRFRQAKPREEDHSDLEQWRLRGPESGLAHGRHSSRRSGLFPTWIPTLTFRHNEKNWPDDVRRRGETRVTMEQSGGSAKEVER